MCSEYCECHNFCNMSMLKKSKRTYGQRWLCILSKRWYCGCAKFQYVVDSIFFTVELMHNILFKKIRMFVGYHQNNQTLYMRICLCILMPSSKILSICLWYSNYLQCADIGHCTLPYRQHLYWVTCLQDEFFQQGDMEKELKMSVSPLMDRSLPGPLNRENQIGFLDVIVLPLFTVLGCVPGGVTRKHIATACWTIQNMSSADFVYSDHCDVISGCSRGVPNHSCIKVIDKVFSVDTTVCMYCQHLPLNA